MTVGRVEAMSKSKRNTVDPGAIIARFGADTARWFILSDNPPDRDMEWTEAGVVGAYRFTQRLFRLAEGVAAAPAGATFPIRSAPAARALAPGDASHHRRGDRGAGVVSRSTSRSRGCTNSPTRSRDAEKAADRAGSALGAAGGGGDGWPGWSRR